mmetsp:Transcript_24635/g.70319  ORF Transcript_24635/g.70319 Transcript_24635/m.70319 type:complete len:205 (+) Transcript_24635:1054-1668(+)
MIRTVDHKSVRKPPSVPRIIDFSSLKISSRITRTTRNTRKSRTTRKSARTWLLLPPSPETLASASPLSRMASTTSTVSKMLGMRSPPKKKARGPKRYILVQNSARNKAAKPASIKIQPNHSGQTSALRPRSMVFTTMAPPMTESKINMLFSLFSSTDFVLEIDCLRRALWIMSSVGEGSGAASSSSTLRESASKLRLLTSLVSH